MQPQNQVEKQGQRRGDNLRPPNKLLHLLKTKSRKPTYYDITSDVDNQIIDKGIIIMTYSRIATHLSLVVYMIYVCMDEVE